MGTLLCSSWSVGHGEGAGVGVTHRIGADDPAFAGGQGGDSPLIVHLGHVRVGTGPGDGQIIGIPVSFNYTGEQPQIGWVSDEQTTDNGAENDKMMRNRGYMKGPNSVYAINGQKTLRQNVGSLRFIVGTFTFQDYAPHYFRVKNIESELGEFHFDYLEYVPVSLIDSEDKD